MFFLSFKSSFFLSFLEKCRFDFFSARFHIRNVGGRTSAPKLFSNKQSIHDPSWPRLPTLTRTPGNRKPLVMSPGGDHAASHIANVDDQYQDAVLVNFKDPLENIYIALRADFSVAAVVPSTLRALPTLQPRPAPVFSVAAEHPPREDFSQQKSKLSHTFAFD